MWQLEGFGLPRINFADRVAAVVVAGNEAGGRKSVARGPTRSNGYVRIAELVAIRIWVPGIAASAAAVGVCSAGVPQLEQNNAAIVWDTITIRVIS